MPATRSVQLGPGQLKAFTSEARFIALVAGVQSGKTYAGANWMNHQVNLYPNDDHLIIASSYKVLSQATLKKFDELSPKGWYKLHRNPENFYYEILPNKKGRTGKGRIWVRSAENPNKIEGMTLRSVWFDEAGDSDEVAFTNICARLSIKQGKCLLTSTPYTWNWLKKFEDDWKADTNNGTRSGKLSYDYINYPSYENPYFPMEEYNRMKLVLPEHDFNRRYLGIFTKPEGLIYPNFNPDRMVWNTKRLEEYLKRGGFTEVIAGVDWGYMDPTVISVVGLTKGGRYILLDEHFEVKEDIGDTIAAAKSLRDKWEISRFYCDSEQPAYISKFISDGLQAIPVRKKKPGETASSYVKGGIGRIRQLMAEDRFTVLDSVTQHLRELQLYRYATKLQSGVRVVVDEPEDKDNHTMDALRYAIDSHWPSVYEVTEVRPETMVDRIFKRIEEAHAKEEESDWMGIETDYDYF